MSKYPYVAYPRRCQKCGDGAHLELTYTDRTIVVHCRDCQVYYALDRVLYT